MRLLLVVALLTSFSAQAQSLANCFTEASDKVLYSASFGFFCAADQKGADPATDLVCSGCVSDSELANNYSGVGACGSHQYVTAVNDNATPTCSNSIPSCSAATSKLLYNTSTSAFTCGTDADSADRSFRTTSDYATTSATGSDIPGLVMSVSANTDYSFVCYIATSAALASTGIQIGMAGPASPTQFTASIELPTALGTPALGNFNALGGFLGNVLSAGGTRTMGRITGVLRNGANAGNLSVQIRTAVALSAVTAHQGSWCKIF